MDIDEANEAAFWVISSWRYRPYTFLRKKLNTEEHRGKVRCSNDEFFSFEINVHWSNEPEGAITVACKFGSEGEHPCLPVFTQFEREPGFEPE